MALPTELKEKAGITPGAELEVRWHDGHLEIEPPIRKVRLERKGMVMVAIPEENGPELSPRRVRELIEDLRNPHGLP